MDLATNTGSDFGSTTYAVKSGSTKNGSNQGKRHAVIDSAMGKSARTVGDNGATHRQAWTLGSIIDAKTKCSFRLSVTYTDRKRWNLEWIVMHRLPISNIR